MRKTGWRAASAANASTEASGAASKYGRATRIRWTYSFNSGALSSGPSSTTVTVSDLRPRLRVTWPAARALRTQLTAP